MKRLLFRKREQLAEKNEIIQDLRDTIIDLVGGEWRVLATPIMIDIDLVDMLLVNNAGQLCAITILATGADHSCIGKIVSDYAVLSNRLDKIKNAYPGEHIDIKQRLRVKLFIPDDNPVLLHASKYISFPLEVYQYVFITSHEQEGVLIEKRSDVSEKIQDYSSLIKIMGENVRSETSSLTQLESDKETIGEDTREEDDSGVQLSPHSLEEHARAGVDEEESLLTEEIETPHMPVSSLDEHDNVKSKAENYFERTRLNEEELVAFFDFEKKMNEAQIYKTK